MYAIVLSYHVEAWEAEYGIRAHCKYMDLGFPRVHNTPQNGIKWTLLETPLGALEPCTGIPLCAGQPNRLWPCHRVTQDTMDPE